VLQAVPSALITDLSPLDRTSIPLALHFMLSLYIHSSTTHLICATLSTSIYLNFTNYFLPKTQNYSKWKIFVWFHLKLSCCSLRANFCTSAAFCTFFCINGIPFGVIFNCTCRAGIHTFTTGRAVFRNTISHPVHLPDLLVMF
jgi:hypothetical protein